MKNILCPINFTDTSLNAIEYACSLANLHSGSLTLFHVVTNEEYAAILEDWEGDLPEQIKRGSGELERKLNSLCAEISDSWSELECYYKIGYGSLTNSIIDLGRQGNFDLIVMGNEGVTNITEALDGSSTVKVIERAPCPVLCVPGQAEFQGLQRVVYGTEFHEADRKALHQLQLMLQPIGSHIYVVHIIKSSERDSQEVAMGKMDELRSYLNFNRVSFKLREYDGNIRLGLNDYMEEVKGELLVLVTHQRGFLQRVFEKSNFKNLSYFADYPMFIFLEESLIEK